ncbi:MAG: hypothetical protein DYH08_09830 [Actinobacteria bacterium ATB1]|nr:hypothetical protein [Actinobacteria bacterium ATB1]
MEQPVSMPWSAPAFTRPPHGWKGVRSVVFPFAPDPEEAVRIMPPEMELSPGPGLIAMLSYPQTEIIHPFKELVVMIPVRVGDVEGNYIPYIYVTTDEALIPGREIALAMGPVGTITGPMPDNLMESQGELAGKPVLNYKLIPGPAGEIEIEEITSVTLDVVPHEAEIGTATVRGDDSDLDPVARLVPGSEGILIAMMSDNTIPAGTVLRRIDRATAPEAEHAGTHA